MSYQCKVTDIANDTAFPHLSGAETRLASALASPKRIAIACIAVLAALGWLALGLMAADTGSWLVLCRPDAAGGGFGLLAPMWAAMALAMMLPTAGPMILTYAEIADTAAREGEAVVSPHVLTAGYVVVWLGFALAAALLQSLLARTSLLASGTAGTLLSGALFVGAGVYQFSSLKRACLTLCQRPFPFFFANWTTQTAGVFRLGLRQGLYCLGCCWAMMLLMLAVGAMNVIWMAALGVVMTIEKMASTPRVAHAFGAAFILIGFGIAAAGLQ
jgi:predicted metal-binding membrane protein